MSAPIKTVLFGLGRMGKNHLRVLRESRDFTVVAVVDQALAPRPEELGGIPYVASIDDIKSDYECAVISTPTATHFDVASELVSRGKHLLVEKPICATFAQGRALALLAEKKGVKLAVGHVERFNPAVRRLREVVREGWLGTPIHFSVTRVGGYPPTLIAGNNVLLDLAVHDIDILRSLLGPLKLEASVAHSTVEKGIFDTAEIFLLAKSGPSATVHVNWITPTKIRTIRVTGTRSVCFVDYILQTCELLGGNLLKMQHPQSAGYDLLREFYKTTDRIEFGINKEEPLKAQLAQLASFIRNGDAGELCEGAEAVAAVLLAERAMQAVHERPKESVPPGPTRLPEPTDEWV